MAAFGSVAQQPAPIIYSGLNISTSRQDIPVPIFWGMVRLPTNCIWYGDFERHNVGPKGSKGGGKGGEEYDYTAAVLLALQ